MSSEVKMRGNVLIECHDARDGSLVWRGMVPNTITQRGKNELAQCAAGTQKMQDFCKMALVGGTGGTGTAHQIDTVLTAGGSGSRASFSGLFPQAGSRFTVGSVLVYRDTNTAIAHADLSTLRIGSSSTAPPTAKETHHIWTITWGINVQGTNGGTFAPFFRTNQALHSILYPAAQFSDGSSLPGWDPDMTNGRVTAPSDSATSAVVTVKTDFRAVDVGGTYDITVQNGQGGHSLWTTTNFAIETGATGTITLTHTFS